MTEVSSELKGICVIPILDGTNYGTWSMRMKIHFRYKESLEVYEKAIANDSNSTNTNKWKRESHKAINIITRRINEKVFCKAINTNTIEKFNLLWEK
ncbi:hypothetical protein O181_056943 [Austropuccinia psidii MF-1]|uniref:DUF4219 domain-containing protein n=1 Tax=Austropuccinia psidii MF-1 TaxID=1389203 RepID=A0A9Q3EE22_9BASI|nr:hypothetical protein [Austropuccinia psidii MF-1]